MCSVSPETRSWCRCECHWIVPSTLEFEIPGCRLNHCRFILGFPESRPQTCGAAFVSSGWHLLESEVRVSCRGCLVRADSSLAAFLLFLHILVVLLRKPISAKSHSKYLELSLLCSLFNPPSNLSKRAWRQVTSSYLWEAQGTILVFDSSYPTIFLHCNLIAEHSHQC